MDTAAKKRILYVEDDRVLARMVEKKLTAAGYDIIISPNGEDGLTAFHETRPDALLVDYHLPGYDGLELIRIITTENALPPTVMLTATGNEEVAVEAMKWGASDYIVKDGAFLELIPSVVEQVLSQHTLEAERQQAEAALLESEATNRALINAIPDIMLHLNRDGKIIGSKLPDYSTEPFEGDITGSNLHLLLPSQVYEQTMRHVHEALTTGRPRTYVFNLQFDEKISYFENRIVSCGENEALCIIRDITRRIEAIQEKEALIHELQDAISNIKTLRGLIPICSCCKKIRDDGGYWNSVEKYLHEHSEAAFSHSYCPQCVENNFPEVYDKGVFR